MPARIKETIVLFLKGCAIGVANIIPGVSGGTLAVILGIYDRLIESIACFFESPGKRKEYIIFLVKVLLGAGTAILLLANLMDFLLTQHFQLTMFAFMGLILGGIPAVWRSHGDMKVRTSRMFVFVLGMIVVLVPALLGSGAAKEAEMSSSVGMAVFGLKESLMLLLGGFLAGGAMIVPGISGSFILVLMGQYAMIIAAIKELSLMPLVFVGSGAMTGILVFSKIIKVCLQKAPATTYYFILGLITASLWEIFPGVPRTAPAVLFAAVMLLGGAGISYLMSMFSES
jgi:putative membrane protein